MNRARLPIGEPVASFCWQQIDSEPIVNIQDRKTVHLPLQGLELSSLFGGLAPVGPAFDLRD